MATFKSLKDLQEYIKDEIQNTLEIEIFEEVKQIMTDKIDEVVYDVYDPKVYRRRYENGGLGDTSNINIDNIKRHDKGVSMKITNDTTRYNSNWNYLDRIIEEGMTDDENAPIYARPRPFIKETREEIRRRDILKKILKKKFSK